MSWKIPLFRMYWDENDVTSIDLAVRAGMNWATGPDVQVFEEKTARYIGTRHCLTFNSGTSALHAALMASGVGKEDEVIVPSFTFIATANAPLFVSARPVFADIEPDTLGLDPDDVLERITPKTKAIVPIHYGGCPCRIKELAEIAEDHNLFLIEDAAESFGARISQKMVGSFGDAAIMSYCQNKIITTGEGGAVLTDSGELCKKMELIRSHGRLETSDYFSSTGIFEYVTLGYNFRMPNILAALGVSQLGKIDTIIRLRQEAAKYYEERLCSERPTVRCLSIPADYFAVYQLFSVCAPDRDALMQYLGDAGIMSKIYFSPVHMTHFYRNVLKYDCKLPITMDVSRQIVSLPFYTGIPRDEMDQVISAIKDFYGRK